MSKVEVDKIDPQSGTTLTLGTSGDTVSIPAGVTLANSGTATGFPEYDDTTVQSNIAMLGFKIAVNGSLTRYNLVDQSIDEFYDTSGIDASASTNEKRVAAGSNYYYEGETSAPPTRTQDADSTGVDGDYTWFKWTGVGTGSYSSTIAQDAEILIVAGGGGGGTGGGEGGGGGAGGLVYYGAETPKTPDGAAQTLAASTTYTATVGDGGTGATGYGSGGGNGTAGGASTFTGGSLSLTATVGGGIGGNYPDSCGGCGDGTAGGSGGGGGGNYQSGSGSHSGGAGTTGQGFAGGTGYTNMSGQHRGAGGGGASAVGQNGQSGSFTGGAGGDGLAYTIAGSSITYAGGGGGYTNGGTGGAGGAGGGGAGDGSDGTDGLGGGGGGGSGDGGSGVVIIRVPTNAVSAGGNLTLQSTDVTAESTPTYGEFVTLIENAYGTATLNTDIKGYVSRDSGVTFTQGTLVDEGTWGTNKQILAFHDLDISSQPSGTSMCYKIETLNQSAGAKETRIYATSIGWR